MKLVTGERDREHHVSLEMEHHVWLEIDGWTVDITADQFEPSPEFRVIVARADELSWHSQYFKNIGPYDSRRLKEAEANDQKAFAAMKPYLDAALRG